jgi:DNA-binding IscR family transcriptional regulator
LPVVVRIGRAFRQGRTVRGEELARSLRIPARAVRKLTQQLEQARLIHSVSSSLREEPGYALAKPPDEIRMTELLDICRDISLGSEPPDGSADWYVYDQMSEVQRKAVGQQTLADMLDATSKRHASA